MNLATTRLYQQYGNLRFECVTPDCDTHVEVNLIETKCGQCGREYDITIDIEPQARKPSYECQFCGVRFFKEVDKRQHENTRHYNI